MEILIEFLSTIAIMNPIIRINMECNFSFFRKDLVSSYFEVSVGANRRHTTTQKKHIGNISSV